MRKPLEGIRVIDLSHVLAMPTCTMQLADLGAEVIKIERPGIGDDSRYFGPFINGESAYFMSVNRNKKSVTLDLKQEEGKEIFKKLVKKADVITENYRANTMEKLNLDYEVLKKINPLVIYASICCFGHYSLDQQRAGYDTIAQSIGGIMSITGYPDGPPTRVGTSVADIFSGSFATIGILAALHHRNIIKEGQYIDISMVDSVFSVLENAVVRYTATGEIATRLGNGHASIAPYDAYETNDGWVVIGAGNDALWEKLCKAINMEELINNPLYITNDNRSKNSKQLNSLLTTWTKKKSSREIVELLTKAGVPSAEVNTIDKIVQDPNIKLRNMLVEMNHPKAGKVLVANSPIRLSKNDNNSINPAPMMGEHTEEVLKKILGMSEEEIKELRIKKVI